MKISNSFRIPVPPDQAWEVLNDVPRVARCAPGAQLLEQRDDGAYVGTVAVRLGPVSLSFKGTFSYKEKDEAAYRVVAEAAGNEAKARGTARATVVFTLAPDGADTRAPSGAGTRVDVETDLQLAGSIAQYGRGAALIQSTAQVIIDQFATNLAKEFNAGTAPVADSAVSAPAPVPVETAPKETGAPETGAKEIGAKEIGAKGIGATEIGATEIGATKIGATKIGATEIGPKETAKMFAPAPAAKPISMTSVLWQAFVVWLKGLFGDKAKADK